MTAPMVFGICMTFHWLLVHRLKPRSLRKGVGLTFLAVGVAAIFHVLGLGGTDSTVVFALVFTGLELLFGADLSSTEEDCYR